MLLTIENLPGAVQYSDIKALLIATCGLDDIVLDNLLKQENYTQKVTIGVAGEAEAAILMTKLHGFYMDGNQLSVKPKFKIQQSSNTSGPPPLMSWNPQIVPAMVPAPLTYNPSINQTAYYQLNQPNYPIQSTPSTSKMGTQSNIFGNTGNKVNRQVCWSVQIHNNRQDIKQNSKWTQNESNWDNNGGFGGHGDRDWGNNMGFGAEAGRGRDNKLEKKWESNRSSDWNSQDTKIHGDREPGYEYNRASRRDDGRGSRSNNTRNSNWSSDRDSRQASSRGSRWANDRDSNRNSYRPNQSGASPRGRDHSYNQDYSQSLSRNISGDNVTHITRKTCHRNDRLENYQNKPSRWADRARSPHAKRSRLSETKTVQEEIHKQLPKQPEPCTPSVGVTPPNQSKKQPLVSKAQKSKAEVWRAQLAGKCTNNILNDKRFTYKGVEHKRLHEELKSAISARINNCFKNNYLISVLEMEEVYSKRFDDRSNAVLLRNTLQKMGGRLTSPMISKGKKGKKNKVPVAPRYGDTFGNLQVDHRNEANRPQTQQPLPGLSSLKVDHRTEAQKPPTQQSLPGMANPNSKPLAKIPGRIPHYPQGVKKIYSANKRRDAALFADKEYFRNVKSELKPDIQAAMDAEVANMAEVVKEECQSTDPLHESFCQKLMSKVPQDIARMMAVNLTRRLIPIVPVAVRVVPSPPINRQPLEAFLKDYNITSLKRVKFKPYYLAHCATFEEHDKLCAMKSVTIGASEVSFKPFHMVGDKGYVTKNAIMTQRLKMMREFLKQTMKTVNRNAQQTKASSANGNEDDKQTADGNDQPTEAKKEIGEEKQLRQDMEQLYSELNDPPENEVKEQVDDKYESPLSDLTAEANIVAIMNNLKEEIGLNIVEDKIGDGVQIIDDDSSVEVKEAKIETVNLDDEDGDYEEYEVAADKDAAAVDDIDMADINDDDLEDW